MTIDLHVRLDRGVHLEPSEQPRFFDVLERAAQQLRGLHRLRVTVRDVHGPRGGHHLSAVCVGLRRGGGTVVARATADTPTKATRRVLDKLRRRLDDAECPTRRGRFTLRRPASVGSVAAALAWQNEPTSASEDTSGDPRTDPERDRSQVGDRGATSSAVRAAAGLRPDRNPDMTHAGSL